MDENNSKDHRCLGLLPYLGRNEEDDRAGGHSEAENPHANRANETVAERRRLHQPVAEQKAEDEEVERQQNAVDDEQQRPPAELVYDEGGQKVAEKAEETDADVRQRRLSGRQPRVAEQLHHKGVDYCNLLKKINFAAQFKKICSISKFVSGKFRECCLGSLLSLTRTGRMDGNIIVGFFKRHPQDHEITKPCLLAVGCWHALRTMAVGGRETACNYVVGRWKKLCETDKNARANWIVTNIPVEISRTENDALGNVMKENYWRVDMLDFFHAQDLRITIDKKNTTDYSDFSD